MRYSHSVMILFAAFAIGGGIGYATFSPEQGSVDAASPQQAVLGGQSSTASPEARAPRASLPRATPPLIQIDEDGNYRLPASMGDRLECVTLYGLAVNRVDLRILGLDDGQINQIQQLVDETFKKCFDREKTVIQPFTTREDELIWKIPGNPDAAEATKQRVIDAIQTIAGPKATLAGKRLLEELDGDTMGFGANDYYLRITPSKSSPILNFESVRIHAESPPTPGTSFEDIPRSSSRRYGGTTPPDYLTHLLPNGEWKPLLRAKK